MQRKQHTTSTIIIDIIFVSCVGKYLSGLLKYWNFRYFVLTYYNIYTCVVLNLQQKWSSIFWCVSKFYKGNILEIIINTNVQINIIFYTFQVKLYKDRQSLMTSVIIWCMWFQETGIKNSTFHYIYLHVTMHMMRDHCIYRYTTV